MAQQNDGNLVWNKTSWVYFKGKIINISVDLIMPCCIYIMNWIIVSEVSLRKKYNNYGDPE